jgi:hypothetical protein
LDLDSIAGPASAARPASSGLGVCGLKRRSVGAQDRKGILRNWALIVTLVAGLTVPAGLSFACPPAENGSPSREEHPKAENHRASGLDAKLILRVYRYARIEPELLERAEEVATGILENAGIRTEWLECSTSPAKARAYPACQSEMGTEDLVLRILPQRMAEKVRGASEEALGFAQPCPENEPACELSVFYSRIDKLASEGYRTDRILGYVIAHEVAHVLIGPGHSDEGIMRREWSRYDLRRISWGLRLDFGQGESRRLRFAVERRTQVPFEESSTQARLTGK